MSDLSRTVRFMVRRWMVLYSLLMGIHFVLGAISVAFPLLAATSLFGASDTDIRLVFGLIASVAAAIVAFLRPDRYGLGFFQAYSSLHVALLAFEQSEKEHSDARRLIRAIRDSYGMIDRVQPAAGAPDHKRLADDGDEQA